jgi:hypothetical protein
MAAHGRPTSGTDRHPTIVVKKASHDIALIDEVSAAWVKLLFIIKTDSG